MQKDFVEDRGPMLVKGGKEIVPNVIKAVEVARERGILIVWVITVHSLSFFLSFFFLSVMGSNAISSYTSCYYFIFYKVSIK